jgi:hypothetical protein
MSYKSITEIKLSPSKRSYEVWYQNTNGESVLHMKGLSLDEAIKETTIINGGVKFLNDTLQESK